MNTSAQSRSGQEQRERLFFLGMALFITVTVASAFGLFFKAGYSSFSAPWWVHLHAVSFMGWIGLYLTQNIFVYRDNLTYHRKLGRLGAVYAAWVILVGLVLTPVTLAVGRVPPFFTSAYFLALDWTNITVFAVLFYAAIINRKRTDWHRRLMLCATISLIAPAWGRLIVLAGYMMTTLNDVGALLGYVVIAMLADRLINKRVHPAYYWGAATLVSMGIVIELLSRVPLFVQLATMFAGQPPS
ncbi:hypothetical protein [Pseudomaricurvus sp. HS19]|uniref:hypothetical protein n=1 Tax=Pseudomaricurvus sp. HS19 TaxID=2692626 RepID=UPI0013689781|nr:hypothetical protein [Pseudomaricurvus sp. HS19]MYM63425.1 hypothetical protein [Pseudomaricurvus sp. HS19]